jgi:hypothetical protein
MGLSVIDLIYKDFIVGDIGEEWLEQARRRCSISKSSERARISDMHGHERYSKEGIERIAAVRAQTDTIRSRPSKVGGVFL